MVSVGRSLCVCVYVCICLSLSLSISVRLPVHPSIRRPPQLASLLRVCGGVVPVSALHCQAFPTFQKHLLRNRYCLNLLLLKLAFKVVHHLLGIFLCVLSLVLHPQLPASLQPLPSLPQYPVLLSSSILVFPP